MKQLAFIEYLIWETKYINNHRTNKTSTSNPHVFNHDQSKKPNAAINIIAKNKLKQRDSNP